MTSYTSPTKTEANAGKFAFYAGSKADAVYIYSIDRQKWVSYTRSTSYTNGTNKAKLVDAKSSAQPWNISEVTVSGNKVYQVAPYLSSGSVASVYMNWYGGESQNALDNTSTTVGFWQDGANNDAGSRWIVAEVVVYDYTVVLADGESVIINGQTYTNGQIVNSTGAISPSDVVASQKEGKFAVVNVDNENKTISVTYYDMPELRESQPYTQAWVYPKQQDNVGDAMSDKSNDIYTLYNKVLAASFLKGEKAIYFLGSKAMNLVAGTELFVVGFGNGEKVSASQMTLKSFEQKDLTPKQNAIGGAEHYYGKALEAVFGYTYKGEEIEILWRAVLRDGSHYLRTEMELKGIGNVDMFDIIAMTYNVDSKEAGSKPATIGNTRGKVIMSNKIFAGLETPTAYNTVGGADDSDSWNLVATPYNNVAVAASEWKQMDINSVPMRVQEVGGSNQTYYTLTKNVSLKSGQKVVVTLSYKSGSHRYNIDGADLLDQSGKEVASDYHFGFCGTAKENNVYSFKAPNDGEFDVRVFIDKREATIPGGEIMIEVYEPKAGAVVNTDIVNMQGRWSRNVTLKKDEVWKVGAVVGLIAQDGNEDESDVRLTQKRRSFLAYSERERAVPWRAFPCYISWYELNINRNNAAPGQEHTNMQIGPVMEILAQWKEKMYDKYGVGPASFIIDDGWDNYGTWTFHSAFPNQMKDMAAYAADMNAGVGAWLGPVGGYGESGNYRRSYWSDKGGMQLSNPAYYETFLTAAENLVKNQHVNGKGTYNFFKFDGISAQFSAVGPDNGDTGNENAEGIIRLEQYVRENLKEDIFFNTTVGTWASPFWYQITDATWRQENDHGRAGNNSHNREQWITYRDNLVHQNYVTASPICPINTLMTHGFMLTEFGPPAGDPRDYKSVLNELRCAFACGSGMVELYNDYKLMNSIEGGKLWGDLAELIKWQKENEDVLMDAHWVGGDPWTGSKHEIYGWASWNGEKATLALRNGDNNAQSIKLTLRQAFEIPANITGSIILTKPFADQADLSGLTEGQAIDIDTELTLTLPGSSVFMFNGRDSEAAVVAVESITFDKAKYEVEEESTVGIIATVNPTNATVKALEWTSSDEAVATVANGLVKGISVGKATITATATDGSGVLCQAEVTVTEKVIPPYSINFDKNLTKDAGGRAVSQIVFAPATTEAKTLQIADADKAKRYLDLTEAEDMVLTCAPGEEINVTLKHSGAWMHGYVYIDLDNDQQFSFKEGSTDQNGTDLVSFFFYNGKFGDDGAGVNSLGEEISGNGRNPGSNIACPKFTAPEAGAYRIRFKVDWNSVDAGGQIAADGTCTGTNGILANGGTIVDATLQVIDPTGIGSVDADSKQGAFYDLSGRKARTSQHGVFIQNGKKVVR
ncbi:MAG: Ig-like domain-containing protein [Bacteroidaceae bacterium]|nr:Ig-like domain-containing protein [Bacteroidaceae bacterium]